jgi:small subunit ribosomal protein S16
MLAIRMQRTGRKGYPMYRVIVQESHRQPTSGRVVANLGSYNPHTKESTLDKEKAATFLKNGAQPSDRVVKLLQAEKVALPEWVKLPSDKKQKALKNAEKLRRNQPKEEVATAEAEEVVEASVEEAAPEAEETTEA